MTTKHVLTDDEKTAIREVYKNGAGEFSVRQIAEHLNVDYWHVYHVLKGTERKINDRSVDESSTAGVNNDESDSVIDQDNPKIRWTEAWWAQTTPEVQARRCVAHRKNGNRCRRASINGATVCRTHGGATRHIRNAAKVRLQNAADLMARELLKMATNDNVSDSVKLAAIKDALDRSGLGAKTEVEITAKPYEQIISRIEGGSREDYRRTLGGASAPPLPLASADPSAPIDAEVVENTEDGEDEGFDFSPDADSHDDGQCHADDEYRAYPTHPHTGEHGAGKHHGDDDGPRFDDMGGQPYGSAPVLMPLDDAVTVAADMRRASARLRPIVRALPPGRSR